MYKQQSAFTHALAASYIHPIIMCICIHRYHACTLRSEDFVDLDILLDLEDFVDFDILKERIYE